MFRKLLTTAAALVFAAGASYAAVFTMNVDRIAVSATSAPVLSSCSTGALGTGSSDTAGDVTATGSTTCTLTFGTAFATAPSCVVMDLTAPSRAFTLTVTNTAIAIAAMTSGDKMSYICLGKAGG